jgi:hypothetical protein
MITKTLLGGAAALAMSSAAHAGVAVDPVEAYPSWHVVLPIELQWDNTFDADDPNAEASDLYFTIEPDITVGVNSWLSLNVGLVFEPVDDLDPQEDRTLEDHGLFVETAQATASFGKFTINVGKFAAPFSIAYDYAPGVYGDVLNADIEVTERWGAGAAYNFTGEGTEQGIVLRVAAFKRDTTALSGSLFTNRDRLHRNDGGNGNTDDFGNFAVALDLIQLEALPEFHFHAAYMFQQAGDGDTSDQNAYVLGANWEKKVGENAVYQIVTEWAHSDGALGYGDAVSTGGASQDDFTIAAGGTWYEKWTAAIGYSLRDIEDPIGGDVETGAFHASAGYFFHEGWLAEVAYLAIQEDGNDSQTLGLKLSREFEWGGK